MPFGPKTIALFFWGRGGGGGGGVEDVLLCSEFKIKIEVDSHESSIQ